MNLARLTLFHVEQGTPDKRALSRCLQRDSKAPETLPPLLRMLLAGEHCFDSSPPPVRTGSALGERGEHCLSHVRPAERRELAPGKGQPA